MLLSWQTCVAILVYLMSPKDTSLFALVAVSIAIILALPLVLHHFHPTLRSWQLNVTVKLLTWQAHQKLQEKDDSHRRAVAEAPNMPIAFLGTADQIPQTKNWIANGQDVWVFQLDFCFELLDDNQWPCPLLTCDSLDTNADRTTVEAATTKPIIGALREHMDTSRRRHWMFGKGNDYHHLLVLIAQDSRAALPNREFQTFIGGCKAVADPLSTVRETWARCMLPGINKTVRLWYDGGKLQYVPIAGSRFQNAFKGYAESWYAELVNVLGVGFPSPIVKTIVLPMLMPESLLSL